MRRRRRFEDRLERELIAAARRRQAEGSADAPKRSRSQGRLRIAVGAGAALAGLALAFALVLPHDGERPGTAASQSSVVDPGACAPLVTRGELELTDREMPVEVRDAIALLRRPQTRSEEEFCPSVAAGAAVLLNPAEVRYAGTMKQRANGTLYLATRWQRDEPQLCIERTPDGMGKGTCRDAEAAIARGLSYRFDVGGVAVWLFVVPDGVTTVELRADNGRRTRLPVRDNVASLLGKRAFSGADVDGVDYALLDAGGAELAVGPVER